ncbi:MAG: hypothetical protein EOP00_10830 [Pedobacter sp.]|nr:MAG: hypothetical protein EOP00_10830 [Pedobacter sp.]
MSIEIKQQKLHEIIMEHLIHFDFIDSCYVEAITCLIEVADTDETALFYLATLSIVDCLSLNVDSILARIEQMEALSAEAKKWEINPYEALKLIYLKTKGIKLANDDVLKKIEILKKAETDFIYEELPTVKETLNYLLTFLVNLFYGNQIEATKITKTILNRHPKIFKRRTSFSVYLLNLLAAANARTNPGKKTDQMEKILTDLFDDEMKRVNPTLYAQSLLLLLKAEQSKNKKDFTKALCYAEECMKIYQRNDLAINLLLTYDVFIAVYKAMENIDKVTEYYDLKLGLLDDKQAELPMFKSPPII